MRLTFKSTKHKEVTFTCITSMVVSCKPKSDTKNSWLAKSTTDKKWFDMDEKFIIDGKEYDELVIDDINPINNSQFNINKLKPVPIGFKCNRFTLNATDRSVLADSDFGEILFTTYAGNTFSFFCEE